MDDNNNIFNDDDRYFYEHYEGKDYYSDYDTFGKISRGVRTARIFMILIGLLLLGSAPGVSVVLFLICGFIKLLY